MQDPGVEPKGTGKAEFKVLHRGLTGMEVLFIFLEIINHAEYKHGTVVVV